ncbi:MAG: hypothetical protein ACRD2L_10170 [Terriglobia bacterium]
MLNLSTSEPHDLIVNHISSAGEIYETYRYLCLDTEEQAWRIAQELDNLPTKTVRLTIDVAIHQPF